LEKTEGRVTKENELVAKKLEIIQLECKRAEEDRKAGEGKLAA